MSSPTQQFRFLELPKELRLRVYELLPCRTAHCTFVPPDGVTSPTGQTWNDQTIVLVSETIPIQVLAVCRIVNSEARPIMLAKLTKLKARVPRIITQEGTQNVFPSEEALMGILTGWFHELKHNPSPDFTVWKKEQGFIDADAMNRPQIQTLFKWAQNAGPRMFTLRRDKDHHGRAILRSLTIREEIRPGRQFARTQRATRVLWPNWWTCKRLESLYHVDLHKDYPPLPFGVWYYVCPENVHHDPDTDDETGNTTLADRWVEGEWMA